MKFVVFIVEKSWKIYANCTSEERDKISALFCRQMRENIMLCIFLSKQKLFFINANKNEKRSVKNFEGIWSI